MSIANRITGRALQRTTGPIAAGAFALAISLIPAPACAQVVRGTVVDEASGRAMPAVVVVLLDSMGNRLAGVLTDDSGRYAIRTTVPGRFALRAERIGYRAESPTPVTLGAGETVELRLATRPIPVVLTAVRVSGKTPCVARAADGQEVSAVWEEAQKALYATELTQRQELFSAHVSRFERTLDPRSGRVTGYQATEANAVTSSPFVSLPAKQLSADGFVRQQGSDRIYYAPDAAALLSSEFLGDHCFRLRPGEGKRSALIGLQFEPARGRVQPDISGTLWLDRASAELRDLEFSYRNIPNLPSNVQSEDFGGRVEFHRMPSGAWIVQRWVIRMPVLTDRGAFAAQADATIPGTAMGRRERVQLSALREEGGEVIETIARGARRELGGEGASVVGTVFDSTRMTPLRDARVFLDGTQFSARSGADGGFLIEKVPPGTYAVSVVHPRFDSLSVRPPTTTITLAAGSPAAARLAGPSTTTILERDCTPDERGPGMAAMRGHVHDAFNSRPAIEAKVAVTWNRLESASSRVVPVSQRVASTRTDSAGYYHLCGLPEGVRLTVNVTADDRKATPLQVLLSAGEIGVLDVTVGQPTVVASSGTAAAPAPATATPPERARNRAMAEFDRRRRRGNGSFLTRTQISRSNASRLTDLLRIVPGVQVVPDADGGVMVELRGARRITLDSPPRVSNDTTRTASGPTPPATASIKRCPAAFQVDGLPVDNGASSDLELRPDLIEAIEVYSGGQVPIELAGRHSECGIILIWTRAFAQRAGPEPEGDGER